MDEQPMEQMDSTTPVYRMYWKAMKATTLAQAVEILGQLIELAIKEDPELDYDEAKAIQLCNIGYFTGYLSDRAEQRRVLALYRTEHPIFGTYEREVTMEKALHAGMALGAQLREGKLNAEALAAARKVIEQP
jgi:hypothetical protein